MKQKTYLVLIGALWTSVVNAAPNELFISEYIEGSSYNKALEFANLSDDPIDLSSYQVKFYFNGSASAGMTIDLHGVLERNTTYVIAHANADSAVLSIANQIQGGSWFNGNDAVELVKNGLLVDSLGQVGVDPGAEWGTANESTKDNTLRRVMPLSSGDIDSSDTFIPAQQWHGFSQNTFDGLGKLDSSDNDSGGGDSTFACGEPADYIHQLQGNASSTTMFGQSVVVEGIVVGDFQGSDKLHGFFLQEEIVDYDDDNSTSEGIFVYDHSFGVDVNIGDRVRVAGKAGEYGGMTQVSSITDLLVCDYDMTYETRTLSLPLQSVKSLESVEGMHVRFTQTLTVSENYNLGRYGELVLSNGRLYNPTNVVAPGTEANIMQHANDLNRIILDDGSRTQNPENIIHPQPELSAFNSVRGGDSVENVAGVIQDAFGAYRIQPTTTPDFVASNPRTNKALIKAAPLKVASFNVLNYFNGDGQGSGFPTARGATNYEEFTRQKAKIVAALIAMEADIIGLMELENDGYDRRSAIADLVEALNQSSGEVFNYIRPQESQLGGDAIAVGMIYNTSRVIPIGQAATLNSGAFADKNRQPLAHSFREIESNGEFTVVVNHFKSKGSCPSGSSDENSDQKDGQGCWNWKRTEGALQLTSWLKNSPTGIKDKDVLIIGDLNAYAMEDPVTSIEAKGYVNLIKKFGGYKAYSYVFYGQAGSLDHALASPNLERQIVDATEWHINTDEPKVLDYNIEYKSSEQVNSLYSADFYRASDHDPVIVGLDLKPENDINNDGRLDVKDLLMLVHHFNQNASGKKRRFDFYRDQKINVKDLVAWFKAIRNSK
ncbi:ExeM/NucH family extracellular endonuclease [Aliikangiella sp. G2MR2-5]|uniref:ExeM/NucH family extracellular endonuclease n=1 Tax=Aliikangiella sp. G2MR2-5 TaxID=2788943 RepID=UPI0018AAC525|nr:ExeM/NucH family extracellular endonuclease [Aliikangiella sp. G2MR2-5]